MGILEKGRKHTWPGLPQTYTVVYIFFKFLLEEFIVQLKLIALTHPSLTRPLLLSLEVTPPLDVDGGRKAIERSRLKVLLRILFFSISFRLFPSLGSSIEYLFKRQNASGQMQ